MFVAKGSTVAQCYALVERRVVVVNILFVDKVVGVASLVDFRGGSSVLDRETLCGVVVKLKATTKGLLPVAKLPRGNICKEPIGRVIVDSNSSAELFVVLLVERPLELVGITATILRREANALVVHRRDSVDVDNSSHSVAPIERRLRTAKYLHPLDIHYIEVEGIFIKVRYIVDIESNYRVVDAST